MTNNTKEIDIGKFLHGFNEEDKYLVNIEGNYWTNEVTCFYNFPDGSKVVKKNTYKPFIYIKDFTKLGLIAYPNKSMTEKKELLKQYGIEIKILDTYGHKRLEEGYKYIVHGKSISSITDYFKNGGVDIGYGSEHSALRLTYVLKPEEQYMIQKGVRLYKGLAKYSDVHKCCYDIETTGLDPHIDRIFMIGIKDNRGFHEIIPVDKDNWDQSEREAIIRFFATYTKLKPAVITHYNGEDFDWNFIFVRCEILGIMLNEINGTNRKSGMKIQTTLSKTTAIRRNDRGTLKVGQNTIFYTKTEIWGMSNIDIIHAAKKTQEINSEIKGVGLKYICKFEKIAKPNRMYLKGDEIYKTYNENKNYLINTSNNLYKTIPEEYQNDPVTYLEKIKVNTKKRQALCEFFKLDNDCDFSTLDIINGKKIVEEYLIDDLIETEAVDSKYNESSFLLAQMIPTTYERICTMGSAAVWKLVMSAWSYENDLAIPIPDEKDEFSGGLARAYYKGYAENLSKIDFAGLYPTLQLTYDAFPDADVTNILRKLLHYMLSTRNTFKKLSNDESLTDDERSFYKTKQLPLKILNNSLFGSLGSGSAFPWGESKIAARITCLGRLELRKMIKYFVKYNYIPILAVTDGVNFSIPEKVFYDFEGNKIDDGIGINELKITVEGKEYVGHDAIVENYNYNVINYSFDNNRLVKLDNDGMFKSGLTLSRINYALLTNDYVDKKTGKLVKGKIKLTGNTIKSKIMPEYIVDFIDKAMDLVLNKKSEEFVEYYYQYLEKLYYKQMPLKKIASKSRVKITVEQYHKRPKTAKGKKPAKQAHMELLTFNNLSPEVGTTIYYVNIGTAKSHGDSKILKNKKTGEEYMASVMISAKDLEDNPEMLGDYNVKKYITNFNKVVSNVFVMFKEGILEKMVKENPEKREFFSIEDLKFQLTEVDSYEDSMNLEEKEIKHWNDTGYDPTYVFNEFTVMEGDNLDGVMEYKSKLVDLNRKRKNKPKIKPIYDIHVENDLVLKKNKDVYTIHQVQPTGYLLNIHTL